MAFLLGWLKGQQQPPTVPTDTVIPLHYLDDTGFFAGVVLDIGMIYDEVLDPEKLKGAMESLLERPGWRKLGARIRRNKAGKHEYHVPLAYSKERPGVAFSHVKHQMRLNEHTIGSQILRGNGTLQVTPDTKIYRPLFFPEGSPTTIKDWLFSDRPQLGLHVVSFSDATLVSLTWPHTLADITGCQLIMTAWTAVLNGDAVPDFHGELADPMVPLGVSTTAANTGKPQEKYALAGREITGLSFANFIFNTAWDLLLHRAEEAHYVALPPSFLSQLKKRAQADLATAPADILTFNTTDKTNPNPVPFVSEGDILAAWYTRLLVSSLPTTPSASPQHTVQILNVLNMRGLLCSAPALLPKDEAFVANCVTSVHTFATLEDVLALPLGHLAARLRKDLGVQATRPQVEACFRDRRAEEARSGMAPMYKGASGGDMSIAVFSNWSKAGLYDVDLRGAVDEKTGEGEKVRPSVVMPYGTANGVPLRNAGSCLKDREGNIWVGGIARTEAWRAIERVVKAEA